MIQWVLIILLLGADGKPDREMQIGVQEDQCRTAINKLGHGGRFNLVLRGEDGEVKRDAQLLYCAWTRDGKFEDFVRPEAPLTQ